MIPFLSHGDVTFRADVASHPNLMKAIDCIGDEIFHASYSSDNDGKNVQFVQFSSSATPLESVTPRFVVKDRDLCFTGFDFARTARGRTKKKLFLPHRRSSSLVVGTQPIQSREEREILSLLLDVAAEPLRYPDSIKADKLRQGLLVYFRLMNDPFGPQKANPNQKTSLVTIERMRDGSVNYVFSNNNSFWEVEMTISLSSSPKNKRVFQINNFNRPPRDTVDLFCDSSPEVRRRVGFDRLFEMGY